VLYESASLASISLFCIGTASAFGWLLAYYRVPQELVNILAGFGTGPITTGFIVALAFLVIGMFIDAIPAIIILGTILFPLATKVGMHPIQFAIIGVISLGFGLVTPPYGLCLLISCTLGKIKMIHAIKDVAIILIPMFILLILVILFPNLILFLPRWLAPNLL
jgi:TRAP-type C4-dicarboxylate transport system permease large subunit